MSLLKKFFREFDLQEKHLNLDEVVTKESKEKINGDDIQVIIASKLLLLDIEHDYISGEMDDETYKLIKSKVESKVDFKNNIKARKIDELITIDKEKSIENETTVYKSSDGPLFEFLRGLNERSHSVSEEVNKIYVNTIINYCTLIEKYFGMIYREVLENDNELKIFNDQELSFSHIKKFGSIEEIKSHLIEEELHGFFQKSFTSWLKSFERSTSVKYNNPNIRTSVEQVDELFLIRNLFIHADGFINERFITKTQRFKDQEINKRLTISRDLVISFREHVLNLIVYSITMYLYIKNKNNAEDLEDTISDIINDTLNSLDYEYSIYGYVYKFIKENDEIDRDSKLVAEVNYLMYLYSFEEELFEDEIKNFSTQSLGIQFKLAKNILLEKYDNVLELIETFINQDRSNLFQLYDWKLLDIARTKDERIGELLDKEIDDIINHEENY